MWSSLDEILEDHSACIPCMATKGMRRQAGKEEMILSLSCSSCLLLQHLSCWEVPPGVATFLVFSHPASLLSTEQEPGWQDEGCPAFDMESFKQVLKQWVMLLKADKVIVDVFIAVCAMKVSHEFWIKYIPSMFPHTYLYKVAGTE